MESYGNKRYSSGILCYNERACGGEEDFAGHVDRTLPLIVRDGRNSLCVRVLCTRNDVRLGNFKGNVDLGERSRSPCYHSVRRTFALRSIGLGAARWWMSILWGLVVAVVSAAVVGGLAYLTGYGHGPGSAAFEKLPLWLITLIVCRAGVVEELFYRGYAIERLRMIGLGRFWSVTIPLVVFSLGHWSGGAANILIALAAGIILTGFYLWRRDLVANMIGHGLVDFVANVVPKLFS